MSRRLFAWTTFTPACDGGSSTFLYSLGGLTFERFPRLAITACVNSVVVAGLSTPIMSLVRIPPSSVTSTACSMSFAAFPSSIWRRSIAALRMRAVGFALFFPAMSGAEPCTASKIATSFPMFADGAKPSPPVRPDVRSLRMSPFMFVVTMTSNCSGRIASWCAQLSIRMCLDLMLGYCGANSSKVRWSNPSVSFMMFALVAQCTLFRPSASAYAYASLMIFSHPSREISLRPSATPGVCMYSMPE